MCIARLWFFVCVCCVLLSPALVELLVGGKGGDVYMMDSAILKGMICRFCVTHNTHAFALVFL